MIRLLPVAAMLAASAAHAGVEQLRVEWIHPTQYVDGTTLPLSDIARTEVEYWPCQSFETVPASQSVSVPAPDAAVTIAPLAAGRWCVRARTFARTEAEPSVWTGVAAGDVTPGQLAIIRIEMRPLP